MRDDDSAGDQAAASAAASYGASVVSSMTTLNVVNTLLSPDGFERPSTTLNGVYPAPLIKATKGDPFQINVVNALTDDTQYRATSIHWHGITQHTTNWADGVAGINQCPIAPEEAFLYQFNPTSQVGTYWYHSHFRTQYCDGMRGPLVIYDPQDPYLSMYDVDDENTIITLGDWYHLQSPSITGVAAADSTLINGKGRYIGGPAVDLAIINVVPGKRYRFRIVAMSCDPNFIFSIDSHTLTIIEADGQYTEPLQVDSIQIFAGQRYSAVMVADQAVGNYWVRALPNDGYGDLPTTFEGGVNSAVLRYAGAPTDSDPVSVQLDAPVMLDETLLRPLDTTPVPGLPFPGGADVNIELDMSFDIDAWRFYVNNVSLTPPSVPVLLQILSGSVAAQDYLPAGAVYTLPKNASVEINIPGGVISSPHPFHLHGHSFSVVRSAGNDTASNYVNPVKRDVVSTGDIGSNTTIRFFTDNSGPWILHCHIDWHLDLGLGIVLAEDPADTGLSNPTPKAWDDLCPIYNALDPSLTAIEVVPTPSAL
ncbi:laccase 8 [Coprinopsis marcescibilis]|uniref:Laccase 8 n=1 Tax=Coprinopsis marcescibilis TaxID=230819 RepID=A0A5C3KH72_COPMA|nr:laccase 8 [Coprinopsis marcescibilis]